MKKMLFLLILASIVSCKKDNSQKPSLLVGNWSFISESAYQNGNIVSTDYFTTSFLTLHADNTGSLTANGTSSLLTYTVDNNTITFYITNSTGHSTITGTIKTLTSSELEINRSGASGQTLDDIYTNISH